MIPAVHQHGHQPTQLAVQCELPIGSMQLVRPRSARRALWPSVPREPYRSRALEALEEAERAIMTPDRSSLPSTAGSPASAAPDFPPAGHSGKYKVCLPLFVPSRPFLCMMEEDEADGRSLMGEKQHSPSALPPCWQVVQLYGRTLESSSWASSQLACNLL